MHQRSSSGFPPLGSMGIVGTDALFHYWVQLFLLFHNHDRGCWPGLSLHGFTYTWYHREPLPVSRILTYTNFTLIKQLFKNTHETQLVLVEVESVQNHMRFVIYLWCIYLFIIYLSNSHSKSSNAGMQVKYAGQVHLLGLTPHCSKTMRRREIEKLWKTLTAIHPPSLPSAPPPPPPCRLCQPV